MKAVNYGLQMLNNRQRDTESGFQKEVAMQSDFLSAPYGAILDEFDTTHTLARKICIPHFTDRPLTLKIQPSLSDTPLFTYAGNLYEGSMPFIQSALKMLNGLPSEQQPHLQFIGNFSISNQKEMVKQYNKISFTPWQDQGLNHYLESSQGLIILLSEDNQDFHTTKFYDFLPLGKPYLYIGPKGKVLKTIEDNNLGCSLEQYNSNSLTSYNPEKALQLARKHTAETMALTILNHVFPE
jgi:hypothetical protein